MSSTLFHCIAWIALSIFFKVITPTPNTNPPESKIQSDSYPANKKTEYNQKINPTFQELYAYSHTPGHSPNYLIAAAEELLGVGFGAIGYYKMIEDNNRDADYTLRSSIKARLNGSALRFDDNDFQTNLDHVTAGAAYYTIARANGLNKSYSLLYDFIASTSWETLVEFREVISINDEINTIWGGFIIGETLHEVLKIFQSGPNNYLNNSVRTIFEAFYGFNDWLAKKPPYYPLDFEPDVWAKLDLYAGAYTPSYRPQVPFQQQWAQNLGLDAQVIDIPLYEQPGYIDDILTDDVFSQFTLWNDTGRSEFSRFSFFAKTTLGAYYKKDLKLDSEERLQGYNVFVGPSVAVDFRKENKTLLAENFYAVIHVLGSTLDLRYYFNQARIRCVLDAYGDFSMMQASAYPLYGGEHDISEVQSVLRNYQYYYGGGYSLNAWIKGEIGFLDLGASLYYKNANLIPQRTRFGWNDRPASEKGNCGGWCEQIETVKLDIKDQRMDSSIWLSIRPVDNLRIQFSLERSDVIGDIINWNHLSKTEFRKIIRLVYSFRSTF